MSKVIDMNNVKFEKLAISNGWIFQSYCDTWTAEHTEDIYNDVKTLCESENLI